MPIMSLLIALILIGLAFWVVRTLVPALGIPEPIGTVILVILVVLVVIWILGLIGGTNFGAIRLR